MKNDCSPALLMLVCGLFAFAWSGDVRQQTRPRIQTAVSRRSAVAVMLDDRPGVNVPLHMVSESSPSSEPAVAVIPTLDVEPPPAVAKKPPAVAEKPPAAISSEFWAELLDSQRLKLRVMASRWDGSLLTRTLSGFRRQADSVADSADGLLQRAAQGIERQWNTRLSKDPQDKTRLR